MLRHLVIEERHGGIFRIANGNGTIDVTGETLEDAMREALRVATGNRAYVMQGGYVFHDTRAGYGLFEVLRDLLGTPEEQTSWHKTPVVSG